MRSDTKQALRILEEGQHTCVLCRGDRIYTASHRGVRPLLDWLENCTDLKGFCAADKVVGRATAFLYCLLGVEEVYARVMSRPAAQVLQRHGIAAVSGQLVDGIINRKGDGPCPFEAAVLNTEIPDAALTAIRQKMAQMTGR